MNGDRETMRSEVGSVVPIKEDSPEATPARLRALDLSDLLTSVDEEIKWALSRWLAAGDVACLGGDQHHVVHSDHDPEVDHDHALVRQQGGVHQPAGARRDQVVGQHALQAVDGGWAP